MFSNFQWSFLPIFSHLQNHMNVKGKNVLVISTQLPWIEAILLEMGARHITILGIKVNHLNITLLAKTYKKVSFLYKVKDY